MKREVWRYPNLEALSLGAAEFVCTLAEKSVRERGMVNVALAGGNTPKPLYNLLAQPPFDARMPWPHVHLFWGDERCVPLDHPDSNFGMARRAFIARVPVPSQNVHPVPAETASPEEAAIAYEKILRESFRPEGKGGSLGEGKDFPPFDLIVLGIGADGHTASLFPGDRVLEEQERWVASVSNPRGSPSVPRVTLTLPVINKARCVLFLVSGAGKGEVIDLIMNDPETASRLYPAARVRPEGRTLWLLDEKALPH